jgi:hypothetical protein
VRPQGGSLVIDALGAVAGQAAAEQEPEWPHPATEYQVDRVTAAVTQTPGMTMTQVATATKMRKQACGIALLKAEEIGLITNTGTRSSPKYRPGEPPWMEWVLACEESLKKAQDEPDS